MSRADDIVSKILSSDRYEQSRVFSQRVYRDEPILRTGADAFGQAHRQAGMAGHTSTPGRPHRAAMPKRTSKNTKNSVPIQLSCKIRSP